MIEIINDDCFDVMNNMGGAGKFNSYVPAV